MTETVPIVGELSYLAAYDEGEWNVAPDPLTYFIFPVDNYDVVADTEMRSATPFTGVLEERHNVPVASHPQGQLATSLFGWHPAGLTTSIMESLLRYAFDHPETVNPPSKAFEWYEGPGLANKRHTGMRVRSATLKGVRKGPVTLDLELEGALEVGQTTVGAAQPLPTNFNKLTECMFSDSIFLLNGTRLPMQQFALQINRALIVQFLDSFAPSLIISQGYVLNFMVMPLKYDDTWDAIRRSSVMNEYVGSLTLKALHRGTGTGGTNYDVQTIALPRMSFANKKDQNKRGPIYQGLQFKCLKPDTSASALSITASESA